MTIAIKHVVVPTSGVEVVVEYTPREGAEFVDLRITREDITTSARLDKEDIAHLINALRRAKKFSK